MLATPELMLEAALKERLADVLPRCLKEVPLYQGGSNVPFATSAQPAITELTRLPFITKHDIRRDFPSNFLGNGMELEELLERNSIELEHTSGTSEERTALLLPHGWWGLQEKGTLRLNPFISRLLDEHSQARRVTLSSPVCSNDICYTGVPSRSERIVGNALFLSLSRYPFLWSEADLARMAAEAVEWQPMFLDADPVYGTVFALYCERRGIQLPSLKFILCSYEFVSVVHRRILERVFKVPVFDLYGSTETGHLLMEDGHGRMRPSLETAFLEVINADQEGVGELVVTTLTNDFMPLIRYRIGDLVERSEEPYGTRYRLHGRLADAFTKPNGRRITTRHIDQCFVGLSGIAHYQLIESEGGWQLRFVPDESEPRAHVLEQLKARLGALLDLTKGLTIHSTDLLVPEGSGKFRLGYPKLLSNPSSAQIQPASTS
jgi:phenylacetate-CoA ligase